MTMTQNDALHVLGHDIQIEATEVLPVQQPFGAPTNNQMPKVKELINSGGNTSCLLDGVVALAYRDAANDTIRFSFLHFTHVLGHEIAAQTEANGNYAILMILLM